MNNGGKMFITNCEALKNTPLFYCDRKTSIFLQKNGFSVLSICTKDDKNCYIYSLTERLSSFLQNIDYKKIKDEGGV